MNTLIVFASYSGGTETAAKILENELKSKSHQVTMKGPAEVNPDEFNNYDLIVLASPSWDVDGHDGQPHEDYKILMQKSESKTFEGKSFAVLGLGDSSYPHFCGAVDVLEKFITDKKGVLKTDSLKIDGFFYDQEKHTQDVKDWADKLN